MRQPDRSVDSDHEPLHRTAGAWVGWVLVAATGSCAVAPTVMAASAAAACAAGQIAATRIDYEGKYNLDATVDAFKIHALVPNVGYTKRTVHVANGYYKEVSEGMIAVLKDKPPGKPVPIPSPDNRSLYARELPSKFVIIETARQKLVYDERGDPEQLGTRRIKSKVPEAEQRAIVSGLQTALASSAEKVQVLGKATYAGITCEVRQAILPGNTVCIARVRGQDVALAEDHQFPNRRERSWMKAKAKTDVCVSVKEFEAPAHVRFKPVEDEREPTEEEQRESDAFFEEASKRWEEE